MPEANIVLPNGVKVSITGSLEDVRTLVGFYGGHKQNPSLEAPTSKSSREETNANGPKGYIRELRSDGFFKEERALKAVCEKLKEYGHIYPQSALSPALIKLVKGRELRRFKKEGMWVYVDY